MPIALGAHNPRLEPARDLLTKQGRREHRAFSFEGATLLSEAMRSGTPIRSLYVTAQAYERTPAAMELEARGTPVYVIEERTMRKISDVQTPSGVLAVAPLELSAAPDLLRDAGVVLALADVGDPGNAGTLLRSAEAFGVERVIFGAAGVEPHHPKVVRAAMGALFRRRVAVAAPAQIAGLLAGWQVTGLVPQASSLEGLAWGPRTLLVVGHERRGLGRWEALCGRLASIRMHPPSESLNAAVAGSIALYEATKHRHC